MRQRIKAFFPMPVLIFPDPSLCRRYRALTPHQPDAEAAVALMRPAEKAQYRRQGGRCDRDLSSGICWLHISRRGISSVRSPCGKRPVATASIEYPESQNVSQITAFSGVKLLNPRGEKADLVVDHLSYKNWQIFFDNAFGGPIISAIGFVIGCIEGQVKGLTPQRRISVKPELYP